MKKSDTPYMSNRDKEIWKAIEAIQEKPKEVELDNRIRDLKNTILKVEKIEKQIISLKSKVGEISGRITNLSKKE